MGTLRCGRCTGYVMGCLVLFVSACTEREQPPRPAMASEARLVRASELASGVGQRVRIVGVIAGSKATWHLLVEDQRVYFDRAVPSELLGTQVEVVGLLQTERNMTEDRQDSNAEGDIVQTAREPGWVERYVVREHVILPR
jgi:hypothetical protein